MKNWYGTFQLFRREVTRFTKIIVDTTISPIVSNLLYLIIFSVALSGRKINGVSYIQFLAPGLICMTLINSSFSNPSFAFVIAKFAGTIMDLLISPLTGIQIVLAYVCAATVRAIFTATLTLIVILLFTHINLYDIPMTVLVAILTSFFFGTLGVIFGYLAKQFDNLTVITTFVMTPMSFLGGVFYPVSTLPDFWKTLSFFNPMFYFIDLFRYSVIGIYTIDPMISLLIAFFANLLLFPFAVYLFSKGKRLTIL
ncbi:MAG: transport permease protein [Candidatus Sericytochromatia bacterium]|nr:MAG: transport permease protein [Candidatus Sericytochromatia bacterium]